MLLQFQVLPALQGSLSVLVLHSVLADPMIRRYLWVQVVLLVLPPRLVPRVRELLLSLRDQDCRMPLAAQGCLADRRDLPARWLHSVPPCQGFQVIHWVLLLL